MSEGVIHSFWRRSWPLLCPHACAEDTPDSGACVRPEGPATDPRLGAASGRAQLREGEAGEAGAAAPHPATPTQRCGGGVTWGKALPSLSTVFSDFPPSLDAGLEKENMYA